jgi:hypothetical protein
LRNEYQKRLKTLKPIQVHHKDKITFYNKKVRELPAHVPSIPVLQKIRQEGNDSYEIVAAKTLKLCFKTKFIKKMDLYPYVNIIFWHRLQYTFYNYFARKNYTVLAIDDTGDVVQNIHPDKNFKHETNLFQIQLQTTSGTSLPIGQMLSQKKDTETVYNFLMQWKKDFIKAPNEMVMDGTVALHNACCKCFNSIELIDYKKHCWKFITDPTSEFPFPTLIRMDRKHFVKSITRWFAKYMKDSEVSKICSRAICLCIDITTIGKIGLIFGEILLLSKLKTETKLTLKLKNN